MNRWTWEDTIVALALVGIVAVLYEWSLRADVEAHAAPRAVPMDTVGCGRLEACTPTVRARWMSVNPFWRGA
jgi:hypothetical protein